MDVVASQDTNQPPAKRRRTEQPTEPMPMTWRKPAPVAITCPKCSNAHDASVCATTPDEVIAAWRSARQAWTDKATHDRALLIAGRHASYAWLAARYREMGQARLRIEVSADGTATATVDAQIARQRLALVQRTAEMTLLMAPRRAEDSPRPFRATIRMFAAMLAVLALGYALNVIAVGAA